MLQKNLKTRQLLFLPYKQFKANRQIKNKQVQQNYFTAHIYMYVICVYYFYRSLFYKGFNKYLLQFCLDCLDIKHDCQICQICQICQFVLSSHNYPRQLRPMSDNTHLIAYALLLRFFFFGLHSCSLVCICDVKHKHDVF